MKNAHHLRSLIIMMGTTLSLSAQGRFDNIEIKATQVSGSIYMLEGAGGNIGVSVGNDGILIVDNQFAPLANKIEAALKDLSKGELHYVLNTHWHGDHTGGNEHFGQHADIIAHANVRKRLVDGQKPKTALPVITYETGISLYFNDEKIDMTYVGPGHTDGDSVVWFTESKVVHVGDLFFVGRFPYIDLNSGGNVRGYLNNIEHLLEVIPDDYQIIPGHGTLANKSDFQAFHTMLNQCIATVEAAIREGTTVEQFKASDSLAQYEALGQGSVTMERWIDTLYRGLSTDKTP